MFVDLKLRIFVLIFSCVPAYKYSKFDTTKSEDISVDWAAHHVVSRIPYSKIIITNQNESSIFYILVVQENLEFEKPCGE